MTAQPNRPAPDVTVRRVSSTLLLKADMVEDYIRLHAAVWPEVLTRITEANLANYSIFVDDDRLIVYYEYVGQDYDGDMARMAEDPTVQRWWDLTRPCAVEPPDTADGHWPLFQEVFHLD